MRNKIIIIVFLINIPPYLFAQHLPFQDTRGWNVLFEDDMSVFNSNLWNKTDYGIHGNESNEEPQLYMTSNVSIENGALVLRTHKLITPIPHPNSEICYWNGQHQYASGQIESKNKYQYGYYEIYAKLPAGKGCWPAFWFWDAHDYPTNPWYNEIDVFEGDGTNTSELTLNVWYGYNFPLNPKDRNGEYTDATRFNCHYSQDYHWYGIYWTPRQLTWYLNQQPILTEKNDYDSIGIQNPLTLFINLALKPDSLSYPPAHNINTMYVDQVNGYQLDCTDKDVIIDVEHPILDFSTYNWKTKKSITLDGQTVIPQNSDIVLYATDFVKLENGFSVPLGASLYIDVSDECR